MTKDRVVESIGDMEGLKIRSMENSLHLRAFTAYGARPLPMAYGEVYTAMEHGVIDAPKAIEFERQEYQRHGREALAKLEAEGVRITRPDRGEFLEAAKEAWTASGDRAYLKLVDAIINAGLEAEKPEGN